MNSPSSEEDPLVEPAASDRGNPGSTSPDPDPNDDPEVDPDLNPVAQASPAVLETRLAVRTETNGNVPPSHYVGIGASAGGLEAINLFFEHMPEKTGMALVVIQHLSPDYKSLMVELLSKRTRMPVHRAEDGMEINANHVYLIPPKKNLTIFHGKLFLSEQDHSQGINLSIDVFFRSLAADQGEKAVAIILSGTGSDGMQGIRAVKEAGGTVFVQDEGSAKFDGMPRAAISTGLADFILPPEDMPRQLLEYLRHSNISLVNRTQPILVDDNEFSRIFALLRERMNVDFTFYKPSTVIRRIERRMSVNQIRELRDYIKYVETYPRELTVLFRELLIGVTNFFRDPPAFAFLETDVLPKMFENAERGQMRFWVPACSTGEEAYSLAILCCEQMERMGKSLDIKIFATDIDKEAIQQAGNGAYPGSIATDVTPERLNMFFQRRGDNFVISRRIREMVVFAQQNLIKDPPFAHMDLISCRNLLIYLQPPLQRKVLGLFHFSLKTGSVLFLGTSETTGEMSDHFEALHSKWRIFRSRGTSRREVLEQQLLAPLDLHERYQDNRRRTVSRVGAAAEDERLLERFLQTLTGELVPLAIIVNEQMEVVYILGNAEGFLRLPSGKIHNDLNKLAVKDLIIPLATGIQKVLKEHTDLKYTNIRISQFDPPRNVQMLIKPIPSRKGFPDLVAVFIQNQMSAIQGEIAGNVTTSYDIGKESIQRIADLEQELQFVKENLQATIEELETSNEELQATNEELLAANEELQSTNEELQSVNEELYTVNAEYQSKIFELTELNNDMDNLLTSTEIGTLFLDENLDIRKFTSQVKQVLKLIDQDVGRPMHHVSHRIKGFDLLALIEQVQAGATRIEREVMTQDGHWYLVRILPYRIDVQLMAGVVITFINIDQSKSTQAVLMARESLLEETGRLARIGGWDLSVADRRITWTNQLFLIHEVHSDYVPTYDNVLAFFQPEARPQFRVAVQRAVEQRQPFDLELGLTTAKGRRIWVRVMAKPAIEGNEVTRISGIMQDITERKRADVALLNANRLLRALRGWNHALIGTKDKRRLFEEKCRILIEVAGFKGCWIAVPDPHIGTRLQTLASSGIPQTYIEQAYRDSEALTGVVGPALEPSVLGLRTRRLQSVRDISAEAETSPWRTAALDAGFLSCLVLPLWYRDRVWGTLSVYATYPDAFLPTDIDMLGILADELAYGLHTLIQEDPNFLTAETAVGDNPAAANSSPPASQD